MRRFILNPCLLISITYVFALWLYTFEFSTIYPKLTFWNSLPICFFIFCNVILAAIWDSMKLYRLDFQIFSFKILKYFNILFHLISILVLLEFIWYGIPIFGMVAYTDFGAPVIHVIVISGITTLSVFYSLAYFKFKRKEALYKFLILIVFDLAMLNRFALLTLLIGFIFSYLIIKKPSLARITLSILLIFIALVGFGELGILRMSLITDLSYEQARLYILDAGYATVKYKEYNLPASIFWLWLYITSPISNLIYNVDIINTFGFDFRPISTVIYEMLPETFSKRIGATLSIQPIQTYLIVPHLNVSTALASVFSGLWYVGIILYSLMYFLLQLVVTIYLKNTYRIVFVLFFSINSVFLVFHNVFKMPIVLGSIIILCIIMIYEKRGAHEKH